MHAPFLDAHKLKNEIGDMSEVTVANGGYAVANRSEPVRWLIGRKGH